MLLPDIKIFLEKYTFFCCVSPPKMRLIRLSACKMRLAKLLEQYGILIDDGEIEALEIINFAHELSVAAARQLNMNPQPINEALHSCAVLPVPFCKGWQKSPEFIGLRGLMAAAEEEGRKMNSVQRVISLTNLEKAMKSRPIYLAKSRQRAREEEVA